METNKPFKRAPKVQELVTSMRATLPEKEDPTFEEKQKKCTLISVPH